MNDATPLLAVAQGDDVGPFDREPANLAQRLAERVAARPNGIVRSVSDDGTLRAENYISLWRRAADIAAALTQAGATPSCTVVILVEDIVDFLPAFWACLRGGFVAVCLTSLAKDRLFRDDAGFPAALASLDNRFFLIDGFFETAVGLAEMMAGTVVALSAVDAEQPWTDFDGVQNPACLVATSGSTGAPKLVALSHAAMIVRNFQRTNLDTTGWHGIGTFPFDGLTGQQAIYLHYESWTQLSAAAITRTPCAILDAIETFDGSVVSLTSSMVGRIVAADARDPRPRRFGNLKMIGVGAEPVAITPMQEFADLLRRYGASPEVLKAGYGTTETGSLVTGSPISFAATSHDAVCLGPPVAGVGMRIVDDCGGIVAQGEIGELEVLCPEKLFSGYWGDPDATRDGFTTDGWWKTKDLGRLVDGRLFLHGRSKETLIVSGKKFSLADIDAEMRNVLNAETVAHACVVAHEGRETLAIIFSVADITTKLDTEHAIKVALARRFGIQPGCLVHVDADLIPKTATGKIRRNLLGALVSADQRAPANPSVMVDRDLLARIWNVALGRDGPVTPDADFFVQGGDSLRSLTLHLQILDAFRVHIPSELFFADPTFDNLQQLVSNFVAASAGDAHEADIAADVAWRLPVSLEKKLLAALETWPGDRPTAGRTMLAFNVNGRRPPIFWVFNDQAEPGALAAQLGIDQPLYAFRSGVGVSNYSEDDIQALALRYMADICAVHPDGPIFIGGNCQGAIIALAIAQHALRRHRYVPLLILMSWAFALQPYLGPVLLIAGRDDTRHNASRLFSRPELAWRRAFASFEFVEIPGGHGEYFMPGSIEFLATCLSSNMRVALGKPLPLNPALGCLAHISADTIGETMQVGVPKTIKVVVTNDSEVTWGATAQSGIALSYRWLDESDAILSGVVPSIDLPVIAPHASLMVDLTVMPPDRIGDFALNIELCEEGNRWFAEPQSGFLTSVKVIDVKIGAQIETLKA